MSRAAQAACPQVLARAAALALLGSAIGLAGPVFAQATSPKATTMAPALVLTPPPVAPVYVPPPVYVEPKAPIYTAPPVYVAPTKPIAPKPVYVEPTKPITSPPVYGTPKPIGPTPLPSPGTQVVSPGPKLTPLDPPAPLLPKDGTGTPLPKPGTLTGGGMATIPSMTLLKTVEPPPPLGGTNLGKDFVQTNLLGKGFDKDTKLVVHDDKSLIFGASKFKDKSILTSKFDKQIIVKSNLLKTQDKKSPGSGTGGGQATSGEAKKTAQVVKFTPMYIPTPTMCEVVADFGVRR